MLKPHFLTLAQYNRWANRRLYDAAAALSDEDRRRDLGAYFGSLHGTLNHLLVGDYLWFRRILGTGPKPARLDEVLHEDFAELRAAREAEDERILATVEALDEARLVAPLDYATVAGDRFSQPLSEVLTHVFNHQTHHRGQAHGLLSQLGQAPPPLDLVYLYRERAARKGA